LINHFSELHKIDLLEGQSLKSDKEILSRHHHSISSAGRSGKDEVACIPFTRAFNSIYENYQFELFDWSLETENQICSETKRK